MITYGIRYISVHSKKLQVADYVLIINTAKNAKKRRKERKKKKGRTTIDKIEY